MAGEKVIPCNATGESLAVPAHTHTCIGKHDAGDHFCGECRRWWWQAPKVRRVKPPRKKS